MLCAISSDWHLGRRHLPASSAGRNQRELDVEAALERVVDGFVALDPDLVLIGGDNFDSVRPSMHAVRAWQQAIRRIVSETQAHVVAVIGNHDGARCAETLTPAIVVDGEPRVHLAAEPRRIRIRLPRTNELVSVACFPFTAMMDARSYRMEPDPQADLNVLLMHAAVRSSAAPNALPAFYQGEDKIDAARDTDAFDVVALGDYHEFQSLVPGRCVVYPGSIERVSSDIWHETAPKGWVAYDTREPGEVRFIEIPTRPVFSYDLDDIGLDAARGADAVNRALRQMQDNPALENAIVRLVVPDFPPADRDSIDWEAVRDLRSHCLHFDLTLRLRVESAVDLGDRRASRGRSVQEVAIEFISGDPQDVQDCVMSYLDAQEAA